MSVSNKAQKKGVRYLFPANPHFAGVFAFSEKKVPDTFFSAEDPDLRRTVSSAEEQRREAERLRRLAADETERKQQEKETLAKLASLESQAKAFSDSGDLKSAVDKYQQALDLIRISEADHPEFAQAIGRISAAKSSAQTRFTAAQQEKHRQEVELADKETRLVEQKRINEENRAKGLVEVEGEWLTKEQALVRTFELRVKAFVKLCENPNNLYVVLKPAYNVEKSNSLTFPLQATLTFAEVSKSSTGNPFGPTYYIVKFGFSEERWQISSILVKDANGIWQDYRWSGFRYVHKAGLATDETAGMVLKAFSN